MKSNYILIGIISLILMGCKTLPYNPEGAKAISKYGDAIDRHILAISREGTACASAVKAKSKAGVCVDDARKFDLGLSECHSQPEVAAVLKSPICSKAVYSYYDKTFYDDWDSKLFSAKNKASSTDFSGLCAKAASKIIKYKDGLSDGVLKSGLEMLNLADPEACLDGSIGSVLDQHDTFRKAHEDNYIIQAGGAEQFRTTLAQSVKFALTVENFKKDAAQVE